MTGLAAAVLAGGISQLAAAVVPAALTALAIAAPVALASLWLRRRSRITHLVMLPPAEEPMFYESGHVIGRDGREAILRRAREEDQAEARADLEREIDEMTRRFGR